MKNLGSLMNVLIFSHVAQEPPYNTMLRYHNWGRELVKRGYNVTIVAASTVHNTEIDIIEVLGRNTSIVDNVNYYYVKVPAYKSNGMKRVFNMLSYCIGLKDIADDIKEPDVIICADAYKYPFVKKYYKGVPIILDIVDLWPTSIVQYTNISNFNPAIQFLYYLEKKAYLESDAIIFSMEGGADYIREQRYKNKVNLAKVFHINMGCSIAQKDSELKGISFELGWNTSDFNLVYCGSVRIANQVQQICEAARIIMKHGLPNIKFHIYGNGSDLDMLKQFVANNNINNVFFYGRIEKEKIPFILANGKANLLTYKNVPLWKYGGSQSKLFDYLASGRPIICNVKFGYNLIERYQCGVVAKDSSADGLANAIEEVYKMSESELIEMGKRARETAEMYDQPILVDKLERVFEYVNH